MEDRGAVGLVAGSGIDLLPLLAEVTGSHPFADMLGLETTVAGHDGRFVTGIDEWGGRVVVQCGRLHLYEGLGQRQIVRTVAVLAELGANRVIFTNAAGGLKAGMRPGDLCAADSVHPWPCRHAALAKAMPTAIVVPGCEHQGSYWWVHGPSYETRAEIGALQGLGAAVVGMSTALELDACREIGLPAAVVSVVTNVCESGEKLSHEHVIERAHQANARVQQVLRSWMATQHHDL